MSAEREKSTSEDRRREPTSAAEAERLRHDAGHRVVDAHGDVQPEGGPGSVGAPPPTGDDRPRAEDKRGALDPYDRGPGEASADDSPEKPKAPAVFQATEDGRLAEPPKPDAPERERHREDDRRDD